MTLYIDNVAKEVFTRILNRRCLVCNVVSPRDKRWDQEPNTSCKSLHFHHIRDKMLYIGRFRVAKGPKVRVPRVKKVIKECSNCNLLCYKYHRHHHNKRM